MERRVGVGTDQFAVTEEERSQGSVALRVLALDHTPMLASVFSIPVSQSGRGRRLFSVNRTYGEIARAGMSCSYHRLSSSYSVRPPCLSDVRQNSESRARELSSSDL